MTVLNYWRRNVKKEPSSGEIGTSGLKNAKRSSHGLTIRSCQQSEEQQHTSLDNGGSAGWSAGLNGPFSDGLLSSIESGFSTNMEDRQASSKSWCLHTTTYVNFFSWTFLTAAGLLCKDTIWKPASPRAKWRISSAPTGKRTQATDSDRL